MAQLLPTGDVIRTFVRANYFETCCVDKNGRPRADPSAMCFDSLLVSCRDMVARACDGYTQRGRRQLKRTPFPDSGNITLRWRSGLTTNISIGQANQDPRRWLRVLMRVDEKKFRCLLCDSATLFKSKLTLCHHIDGKGASSGPRCRATKEWVKRMSAVDQDIADLGVVLAQGARAAPHEYHKRQQLVMNDRQPALPHEAAYLKGVSPPPVQQARGAASAASAAAAQVADLMARLSIAEQETAVDQEKAAAAERAKVQAEQRAREEEEKNVRLEQQVERLEQQMEVLMRHIAHGSQIAHP